MKLVLKDDTVNLNGLCVEILGAMLIVMCEWDRQGMSALVITSAIDGEHIENSLHYEGKAIDIRTRSIPDAIGAGDAIRAALSPEFDVLIYPTHMHIEYDPK